MEWTGRQQIFFLLQSVGLGAVVGFCLDSVTALSQRGARRRWLFSDILFGPVAALLVFFGALVIMDGQLHPLLILGSFLGMFVEHVTLGLWVRKLLILVRRWYRKIHDLLVVYTMWFMSKFREWMHYIMCFSKKIRKIRKKHEK